MVPLYIIDSEAVKGNGFVARGITFQNWAGPKNGQAVALLISANDTVVYKCSMEGYQDTLYVHRGRQFYRECHIYGTVDFIFGDATVVFQNCTIYSRRPLETQFNAITAHKRHKPEESTGISIHQSKIMPAPELVLVKNMVKTYLGRPWDIYARVVYISCQIEDHVDPRGWTPWNDTLPLDKLYYGEYKNSGTGSLLGERVKWKGVHNMTVEEAQLFTVDVFINGSDWLPLTGVPFIGGL